MMNITPFSTFNTNFQKPFSHFYETPVYDPTDLVGDFDDEGRPIGDGTPDSPGKILYWQKNYSGTNKDSYSILQDAFVHILRNSIDHGIEDPEERKKIGKRPSGKIVISCKELEDDRVEISIEDDGGGINVGRVAAKAIENGIITHEKKDNMKQTIHYHHYN